MSDASESVLGYRVRISRVADLVETVMRNMEQGQRAWLACLNPHSFVVSRQRAAFAEALHGADLLVPDGVGIVLASRILGGGIRQRVTGFDIFSAVNAGLERRKDCSVFFLGSSEQTLLAIRERMAHDWPHVHVAGTFSPPFKATFSAEDSEEMVARINAAKPDVLWVGMTAPKQEEWIHAHWPRLDVRFAAAIGAVFDFYGGHVRRSHPMFQRMGLEWLPRLLQQPRRLWRRTFISAPVFLWHVAMARLGGRRHTN